MKNINKFSILSISLITVMAGAAIAPALDVIAEFFEEVDPFFIKMILTVPAIMVIPFSLLSGKLVLKFNKRTILIVGLVIYIIGGLGVVLVNNIFVLLFLRVLLGAGVGLIMPLSTSIISDFYTGEEKTRMMGYSGAINNLGAFIATFGSGLLAMISWRYSFFVYVLAFIVLFFVIFKFPTVPHSTEQAKVRKSKVFIDKNTTLMGLSMFMVMLIFYSIPTTLSFYIGDNGWGNATVAGILISLQAITQFIVGLNLVKLTRKLKGNVVIISIFLFFVGFLFLSIANNIMMVAFAVIFTGIGMGTIMPLIFSNTGKGLSIENRNFAFSIVSSSLYLGQFASPVLVKVIENIFKVYDNSVPFIISATITFIVLLVIILINWKKNNPFNRKLEV